VSTELGTNSYGMKFLRTLHFLRHYVAAVEVFAFVAFSPVTKWLFYQQKSLNCSKLEWCHLATELELL
jgi:hypothetical protein